MADAIQKLKKNVREKGIVLSESGLAPLQELINREIVPVLLEIHARHNELVDFVAFEPTDTLTESTTVEVSSLVKYDPTGGSFVITVPSPEDFAGLEIVFKNVTADLTPIALICAELIEGSASQNISGALLATRIISDGSTWWFV